MISLLFRLSNRLFDILDTRLETLRVQRLIANVLILSFLGGLIGIELNRQGLLPPVLRGFIPTNHFYAVDLAFILLLFMEVIALVFALVHSVSNSVGKQFEVLSLILLRQTFKELIYFDEPIHWGKVSYTVLHMLSDATGALLIFIVLGFYYRVQLHLPMVVDKEEQTGFVTAKKLIALLLLVIFAFIGLSDIWVYLTADQAHSFFERFYTVLIFSDILIVLISLRYSTNYRVIFRYFGFAVTTLLIRLALTAPPYIDALLGVGATIFALALTLASNAFAPVFVEVKKKP